MRVVFLVAAAATAVSGQGLFENLDSVLLKRDTATKYDSCGIPLKSAWHPKGRYSKQQRLAPKRTCDERRAAYKGTWGPLQSSSKKLETSGTKSSSDSNSNGSSSNRKIQVAAAPAKVDSQQQDVSPVGQPAHVHQHNAQKQAPSSSTAEVAAAYTPPAQPQVKVAVSSSSSQEPTTTQDVVAAATNAVSEVAAKAASVNKSGVKARGLAWAVNDNWAPTLAQKEIGWLYHWQDGPVATVPNLPYVPMLWGTNGNALSNFQNVMSQLGDNLPEYLLGFNEPDIPGQANMSPDQAASAWKQYLEPYAAKGVKLCSPAIAYDVDWMKQFMSACTGCHIDCIAMHSYDPYDAGFTELKNRVETLHSTFPEQPIWLTEFGLQAASGPSDSQTLSYLQDASGWLESTGYVERYAWFGCWSQNPDGYAVTNGRFFNDDGSLTAAGNFYAYS